MFVCGTNPGRRLKQNKDGTPRRIHRNSVDGPTEFVVFNRR